jgi:integrase
VAKLTMRALREAKVGAVIPDPAVPGLRYQQRARGLTAQLRVKLPGKGWQSHGLGYIGDIDELAHDYVVAAAEARGEYDEYGRLALVGMSVFPDDILGPIRQKARELRQRLRKGEDPKGGGITLGVVVDDYLAHIEGDKRPKTVYERTRYLRRDWAPLHRRPLAALLSGEEIAAHVLVLKARNGIPSANRARAALNALFRWAVGLRLIPTNPVPVTGKAGTEKSRSRVLSMDELRAIWAATGDEGPAPYNSVVRLLALTGQRREEVGGMMWQEVDLERALWSLPEERTKNGRPHLVPLSEPALAMLRGIERRAPFVFGDRPYNNWSQSKAKLDKRCGVAGFTLHDLRRSFITHCAEDLRIEPHVLEACVNHASGKTQVAGIYNRAVYLEERTRAMRLWAGHLLGTAPAQVIPLHAGAGAT